MTDLKPLHPWKGEGEYAPSSGENHAVGFAERMSARIARANKEREAAQEKQVVQLKRERK